MNLGLHRTKGSQYKRKYFVGAKELFDMNKKSWIIIDLVTVEAIFHIPIF